MSEEKLSRQQRKQLIKEEVKQKVNSGYQPQQPQPQVQQLLLQEVQKVLNYAKMVDNHVWVIIETLSRKGIISWADVNETETLYSKREETKKKKIKELLEKSLSVEEYLKEIEEDQNLQGYEKLTINPVKDLNLNPFEVATVLREKYPSISDEEYLKIGKVWELTKEHFGIKEVGPTGLQG